MTIDEAIERAEERGHAQLADWLRELRLARMETDLLKTLRDGFKADAQKYKAENAKLRELCAEMFEAVKYCCGEWCAETASSCDNNECGWRKCYVALRELGIEEDG